MKLLEASKYKYQVPPFIFFLVAITLKGDDTKIMRLSFSDYSKVDLGLIVHDLWSYSESYDKKELTLSGVYEEKIRHFKCQ